MKLTTKAGEKPQIKRETTKYQYKTPKELFRRLKFITHESLSEHTEMMILVFLNIQSSLCVIFGVKNFKYNYKVSFFNSWGVLFYVCSTIFLSLFFFHLPPFKINFIMCMFSAFCLSVMITYLSLKNQDNLVDKIKEGEMNIKYIIPSVLVFFAFLFHLMNFYFTIISNYCGLIALISIILMISTNRKENFITF